VPVVRPVPWIALAFTLLGCGSEPPSAVREDTEQGKLLVVVTVDWEGDDLREENLAAMERLRERFPEVELVQFLNAANSLGSPERIRSNNSPGLRGLPSSWGPGSSGRFPESRANVVV